MRRTLIWLFVVACSSSRKEPPPPTVPDPKAAAAAAKARNFKRCAELWLAVAASTRGESTANPLYNAACCYAQDGNADTAFATLDRAIAAGFREPSFEHDPDLVTLHTDARWPALVTRIAEQVAAAERAVTEPALRRELLAMQTADTAARTDDDPEAIEAIDAKTTARMKAIVAQYGWPGKSLVGADGAHAAWLLVQHSHDVAFQEACLEKIELALTTGEAKAIEHAYLSDRIAVNRGKPQRYGTQLKDGVPYPIEDEANVDERRQTLGLPTMAEQMKLHE